jgi:hypothetical protein
MDAQLLYAKAVGDREGLETRAAAAEEQGASVASDLERARAQAASDAARLRELHDSALALTAEVARLAPLAPRAATLEAEKASLEARCERATGPVWGRACLFLCGSGSHGRILCLQHADRLAAGSRVLLETACALAPIHPPGNGQV